MKVAIALIGEYSSWYKRNKYEGDLFAYTFDFTQQCAEEIPNMRYFSCSLELARPQLNEEPLQVRPLLIYDYMVTCVKKMIDEYQTLHGFQYDIVLYTSFKTILLEPLPTRPGNYSTPFYSQISRDNSHCVPGAEIVSDTHIRWHGGFPYTLYELPQSYRRKLYSVFNWKNVYEPDDIPLIPFNDDMTFYVPSVINTASKRFNYIYYRSMFTGEERLQQTIDQIHSIVSRTSTKPCILEGSRLTLMQLDRLSREQCTVVLFCLDTVANEYANSHTNKSIYEVYVMRTMLEQAKHHGWSFKFGGRYHFASSFRISDLTDSEKPVFKVIPSACTYAKEWDVVECILYGFPEAYKKKFIQIYASIQEKLEQNTEESVERYLSSEIANIPYKTVTHLSIIGKDAIEGIERIL